MELDTEKIDEAVLALLYLGLHDGARAWKGFDWDSMNRLHEQGFITDPRSKAKPVVFTEEGLSRSKSLLEKLFSRMPNRRVDRICVTPPPAEAEPHGRLQFGRRVNRRRGQSHQQKCEWLPHGCAPDGPKGNLDDTDLCP